MSIGSSGVTVAKLHSEVTLDCCGLAKGYALGMIAGKLEQAGYTDYFLELGGEVLASGHHPSLRPWRAGVEIPSISTNVRSYNTTVPVGGQPTVRITV